MENFATRKELTFVFCVQIYSSIPDINICCGEISFFLKYILLFIIISYTETESTFLVRETKRKKNPRQNCALFRSYYEWAVQLGEEYASLAKKASL